LNPGVNVCSSNNTSVHIYPFSNEDKILKSSAWYEEAYEIRRRLSTIGDNEPYCGVMQFLLILLILHDNLANWFIIQVKKKPLLATIVNQASHDMLDIFHSLYEGVCRQLLFRMFLLNQKACYKNTSFYLGYDSTLLGQINEILLSIKVSQIICKCTFCLMLPNNFSVAL